MNDKENHVILICLILAVFIIVFINMSSLIINKQLIIELNESLSMLKETVKDYE